MALVTSSASEKSTESFKVSIPLGNQLKMLAKEPAGEEEAPFQLSRVPAQIPDTVWKPVEQGITNYVRDEINEALAERAGFVHKLARWKYVYEAPMPEGPKTFPFFGASDLTMPVVKEAVNTLTAQLVQTTLTAKPIWVLQDLAEEWEPFVDKVEKYMDIGAERELKLHKIGPPWITECAKFGTAVMELGNQVDVRKMYQRTSDGKRAFPREWVRHDGPKAWHVPLEDFIIRFTETDPQEAPWCGKRLQLNEVQLRRLEKEGKIFGVDEIIGKQEGGSEPPQETTRVDERVEQTVPVFRQKWTIYEIWLTYQLEGDEDPTELLIYYSDDLEQIVGREFHPYFHGMRPFTVIRYFPKEHRFYGEGLCEMLEQIQEAVSARFNQRSDNITLNSLMMFLRRKGVRGLQPGDPLYAGKIIEVLDIHTDIAPLRMGEIYPSTVQEELLLREQGERLAGLNDATMGSALPVTRTTASAQLALLQEQTKRIDLTVRSIRDGLNEVGMFYAFLNFQFGIHGKGIAWMGMRGKDVEAVFSLPKRVIELGMAIRVQVPTSMQNRQVKRENALAMFNLLNALYEKLLPLVQILAPEHLTTVVHAMVKGGQKFLGDVLEAFDTSDPEEALAGLTVLERVLPRAEDMGGLEAFARSAESAEVLEGLAGLENLLRAAESARGGDPGVSLSRREPRRTLPPPGEPANVSPDLLFGGLPG
jgi:hypothetical protein